MKGQFLSLSAVILCLAAACSRDNGLVPMIELVSGQKEYFEVDPYDNSLSIRFSSALEWHAELQEGVQWVKLSPSEGKPGAARIAVLVKKNPEVDSRTAIINICSEDISVPITIVQDGFTPTFELLKTEKEISASGGMISVPVRADVDYECKVEADWIRKVGARAVAEKNIRFDVDPNPLPEVRSAVISFVYDDITHSFTVSQRAAGTEADDWKKDDFVHRSLGMRFTADWCGYCPNMAKAFEEVERNMGDRFLTVSLHGNRSALELKSISPLIDRFHVSGFPTGIVDARAAVQNFSNTSYTAEIAMALAEETQANYPASTGIVMNTALDGTSLDIDLSLYVKEADTYKVVVLLLEDDIIGNQSGVANSDRYEHDNIARLAITSISGESVKIDQDYTVWEKTYSATVPSGCDPEHLRILVYVEKPYGTSKKVKEVKDAKYGNYGETYIDNCRTVKVGENVSLELEI